MPDADPEFLPPTAITRREALQRAAVLLGLAISPSLLAGALGEAPAPGRDQAKLSAGQLALVGAVAERILPRTDTPGALDAGVPDYVAVMYEGYLTPEEQKRLVSGIAWFESQAGARGAASFAGLAAEQQDEIIRAAAESDSRVVTAQLRQLRELAIVGYFTSELVGKSVLQYNPVPGPYQGCLPLAESGGVNSGVGR